MKSLNMDQMEDMYDDLADLMADQEEIQEIMTRSYQCEYDESELMGELNELDEEIINEQLNDGLDVTSYIPKQHATGNPSASMAMGNEDEQLKNMMQI